MAQSFLRGNLTSFRHQKVPLKQQYQYMTLRKESQQIENLDVILKFANHTTVGMFI